MNCEFLIYTLGVGLIVIIIIGTIICAYCCYKKEKREELKKELGL